MHSAYFSRFAGAVVAAALLFVGSPAFAIHFIHPVTVEEAKEMGLTIDVRPNGEAGMLATIEFKPAGSLKDYRHVQMHIRKEGVHLAGATLKTWEDGGKVSASFSTDAGNVSHSTFTIVVPEGGRGAWIDYEFKLKDFVKP